MSSFSRSVLVILLAGMFQVCATSIDAQWWARQRGGSNTMPPAAGYASGRDAVKVEPTPDIKGADQNTFFQTFSQFDVFPSDSDRTPYGGMVGSAAIVNLSVKDVVSGIERRELNSRYNQWRSYLNGIMRNTSGTRTGSELNGLGRLAWFNKIMSDPLEGAGEAEEFTRLLHINLCTGQPGFIKALKRVTEKLDADAAVIKASGTYSRKSPEQALKDLEKALTDAKLCQGQAIAPLTQDQLKRISTQTNNLLTVHASVGHTVSMRGSARNLIIDLSAIDRAAMNAGLANLSLIMNPEFIKSLDTMKDEATTLTYEGIEGPIV